MNKVINTQAIQQKLAEKRAVLLARLRVKHEQADDTEMFNPDRSDLAQDYSLQERQLALADRLENTLAQVEAALQRIDAGTYGQCARCGEKISPERLAALPYAEFCLDCQELEMNET